MSCSGFFGRGALVYVCVYSAGTEDLEHRAWKQYVTPPPGVPPSAGRGFFRSPPLLIWDRNDQSITLRTPEKRRPIDVIEIGMRSVISIQLVTDPAIDAGKKVKVILTRPMGTASGLNPVVRGEVIENTDESITIGTEIDGVETVVEIPKSNVDFIIEEKP